MNSSRLSCVVHDAIPSTPRSQAQNNGTPANREPVIGKTKLSNGSPMLLKISTNGNSQSTSLVAPNSSDIKSSSGAGASSSIPPFSANNLAAGVASLGIGAPRFRQRPRTFYCDFSIINGSSAYPHYPTWSQGQLV